MNKIMGIDLMALSNPSVVEISFEECSDARNWIDLEQCHSVFVWVILQKTRYFGFKKNSLRNFFFRQCVLKTSGNICLSSSSMGRGGSTFKDP